jgi:hypothetical protein
MDTSQQVVMTDDVSVVSENQDPLYRFFGKENIAANKKYADFDPNSTPYGNVYMQKARGRILFVISEMNTTRKFANLVSNPFTNNKDSLPTKRGAAYREALMEILTLDDATLGSYSVTGNLLTDNVLTRSFGSMFNRKGGKRSRKSIRKTRKRSKK